MNLADGQAGHLPKRDDSYNTRYIMLLSLSGKGAKNVEIHLETNGEDTATLPIRQSFPVKIYTLSEGFLYEENDRR
jgi:hypothetical protein